MVVSRRARRFARALFLLLLLGAAFVPSRLYGVGVFPTDTTVLTSIATPPLPRPGYLSPIIDPTFHTKITRVSDQAAMGSTQFRISHWYAKNSPWNSDQSLVFLSRTYPAPLLDGTTYQFLRNVYPPDYPQWSHIDPKKIFGISNMGSSNRTKLVTCNIDTCDNRNPATFTLLHDFSVEGYTSVTMGQYEGNMSDDDRYVPIQADSGSNQDLIVWDTVTNQQKSILHEGTTNHADSFTMSHSGTYVVVSWEGAGGKTFDVYDINFTFLREPTPYVQHWDVGVDMAGHEVLVMPSAVVPGPACNLVAIRLDGGGQSVMTACNPGWNSPGHISCRNYKRPGWCYVSDDGATPGNTIGYDEIVAVRLDNSGTFERFGHEHHTTNPISCYECAQMGTVSPDGTKVMFGSDWGSGSAGPIYAYIAEMPGSTQPAPAAPLNLRLSTRNEWTGQPQAVQTWTAARFFPERSMDGGSRGQSTSPPSRAQQATMPRGSFVRVRRLTSSSVAGAPA